MMRPGDRRSAATFIRGAPVMRLQLMPPFGFIGADQ
jgi:hypothetical protein